MIGKTISHYKILEKLGSPCEIPGKESMLKAGDKFFYLTG
jgi:hypothetical protein